VKVFAQQFAWRFEYDGNVRTEELVLPVHRGVKFEMTSADVIHSFWVPQFGQKQDVVPGITTSIVVTPTRTGRFTLICTELCGLGHATMRAPVRVLGQGAFDSWLKSQQAAAGGGGETSGGTTSGGTTTGGGGAGNALGAKTFASAGCGGCHTFAKAGSDGEVGPSLDDLTAAAKQAGESVSDYVRQSIVDPNKVVVSGYQPNVMPQTFGQSLSKDELDALVAYVSGEEAQ
jgi:cytochrome c oxidase subunit 2